jgi:hypothetical protein
MYVMLMVIEWNGEHNYITSSYYLFQFAGSHPVMFVFWSFSLCFASEIVLSQSGSTICTLHKSEMRGAKYKADNA